jgi:hypothetical protein
MVTTPGSDATEDIFWKVLMETKTVEDKAGKNIYYDVEKVPCRSFRKKILAKDNNAQFTKYSNNPDDDHGPTFTEEELTVFSTDVEDIDEAYLDTPIAYMGDKPPNEKEEETTYNEIKTPEEIRKETLESAEAAADIDTTRTFVSQRDTTPSQWWVLKTARQFKLAGWPFWLEIRNSSSSARRRVVNLNNSLGYSFVSIKLRDGGESKQKNFLGNNTAYIGDVELVAQSDGKAYVLYQMIYPNDGPDPETNSDSKKNPQRSDQPVTPPSSSGEKKIKPVWKKSEINMPYLQKMFSGTGESCIIGFVAVLGRLVMFDGDGGYTVVSFSGDKKNSLLGFNLDTNNLLVCGYGCASSIALSRMVFPKRAYTVMKDMDPDSEGYLIPATDNEIEGLKAGALCDGRIISQPISIEMYRNNLKKSKNGGKYPKKQYGASFSRYVEVIYTPPDPPESEKGEKKDITTEERYGTAEVREDTEILMYDKVRRGNSVLKKRKLSNWTSGMYNLWGELHMVRYEKTIPAIKEKKKSDSKREAKFWFVYFETETLRMKARGADGKPVDDLYVECQCGFPVLYSFVCKSDRKVSKKRKPRGNRTYNITNDVVSVSVDRSLDSPRPTIVESKATVKVFDREGLYGQFLAKARGIGIWMRWSTEEPDDDDDDFFTADHLVFSGIAFGRSRDQAPGEEYVTFECFDHWLILEGMQIKNSPFYDGFRVDVAIEDLCKKAGLRFRDDTDTSAIKDGGPAYQWLGQGTTITEPRYRFSAEKTIKDCIMEVIRPFESYVLFDPVGRLLMRPVPGGFDWSNTQELWDPNSKKTYFTDIDSIEDYSQLITGQLAITSTASSSMYNSFALISINRYTGGYVIYTRSNLKSLLEPTYVGYLGYIKEMRQQRPDLGGEEGAMNSYLRKMIKLYTRPGFEVNFTTPGHIPSYTDDEGNFEPIYPGQFIRLRKDKEESGVSNIYEKRFRVLGISHSYEASSNEWNTEISAYQVESPTEKSFDPSQKTKA